jgi:hypothetical protein
MIPFWVLRQFELFRPIWVAITGTYILCEILYYLGG